MKYSFIIPSIKCDYLLERCIDEILKIKRDDYEIVVCVVDFDNSASFLKTKILESHIANISIQRNIAIDNSSGEFLVFIDSDAFPKENILEILDRDFDKNNFNFVSGPNITPKDNSLFQKASGFAMAVFFPQKHYPCGEMRTINFMPFVNIAMRKDVFYKVSELDYNFRCAEDIYFCFIYENIYGKTFIYDPELVVFHERRKHFWSLVKQYFFYGFYNCKVRTILARDVNIKESGKFKFLLSILLLLLASVFLLIFNYIYFLIIVFVVYLLLTGYCLLFFRKYEKNILTIIFGVLLFFIVSSVYSFGYIFALFNKDKELKSWSY